MSFIYPFATKVLNQVSTSSLDKVGTKAGEMLKNIPVAKLQGVDVVDFPSAKILSGLDDSGNVVTRVVKTKRFNGGKNSKVVSDYAQTRRVLPDGQYIQRSTENVNIGPFSTKTLARTESKNKKGGVNNLTRTQSVIYDTSKGQRPSEIVIADFTYTAPEGVKKWYKRSEYDESLKGLVVKEEAPLGHSTIFGKLFADRNEPYNSIISPYSNKESFQKHFGGVELSIQEPLDKFRMIHD